MNEFSKRANAFINLAESFASELNDKLAEDKDDTMNLQDIFNQGYDDGYRDGYIKGCDAVNEELVNSYEESISFLDDELDKMNGKFNEQIVMWNKERQRADELQSIVSDMNTIIMHIFRSGKLF